MNGRGLRKAGHDYEYDPIFDDPAQKETLQCNIEQELPICNQREADETDMSRFFDDDDDVFFDEVLRMQ